MNKICLIGRITKDPDVKTTSGGNSVCQFSIAVNREYKNANGEYDTDFINCVAWRTTADYLGNYVKKGNLLSVVGALQNRSYADQNGEKKIVTEVIVESVKNLSPKPEVKQEILTPQPSDDLPF